MGSANRGTAIAPVSTIGTRYGNSVSTASMPPKPTSKLSLKWLVAEENQGEKPIRNFSIDPASSIRTSIADPVFADPVSETPRTKFHVLMSCVPPLVHIFIFCKSLPLCRWNSYVAFHTPICLTCTTFVGDVLGTGFTGTIPTHGLRPSRGHVPVVPLKCPSCPADILSNSGWPRFSYGSSGKGFSLYLSTVREKKKSAVPASVPGKWFWWAFIPSFDS